ncbi:hypothetical protein CEXT_44601 [Caerostris extrusa]|uniref:Uncharacterized protein n=1 Tax=Caerostris extrusa TaxID=172846 RepID=A0AAV4QPT4_CAEEX|nr:hypothetical protein CEXT_44601 [Caerostris extrusa]
MISCYSSYRGFISRFKPPSGASHLAGAPPFGQHHSAPEDLDRPVEPRWVLCSRWDAAETTLQRLSPGCAISVLFPEDKSLANSNNPNVGMDFYPLVAPICAAIRQLLCTPAVEFQPLVTAGPSPAGSASSLLQQIGSGVQSLSENNDLDDGWKTKRERKLQ